MQLFFIVNLLSAIYLSGKSGKFPIKDLGIINAALRLIKAVHGAVGSVGDVALGGVGGRVLRALIARGREIGLARLSVQMVYHYNAASLRCFEKAGFMVSGHTEKGVSCTLELR